MLVRLAALGLVAFFVSRLAAGPGLVPGDVWVALETQRLQAPLLTEAVAATNWFGHGIPRGVIITLVLGLGLLLGGFRAEAFLLTAASAARLLNAPLKLFLNSPRPTLDDIAVIEDATGFGYPSGHAMGAVLFFGALVIITPALVRHRGAAVPIQLLLLAAIPLTGFGRVAVGAHWPSDVLGGYLFGLIVLLPLGWLYHEYRWRINLAPGWFTPRLRQSAAGPSGSMAE